MAVAEPLTEPPPDHPDSNITKSIDNSLAQTPVS